MSAPVEPLRPSDFLAVAIKLVTEDGFPAAAVVRVLLDAMSAHDVLPGAVDEWRRTFGALRVLADPSPANLRAVMARILDGPTMSIRVTADVWKHSRATGTPLLVLLALADWADEDGESFPSTRAIAEKARLKHPRNVKRIIHETLQGKLGEVEVIRNAGRSSTKGGLRSNRYRVTVRPPDDSEMVAERPPSDSGSSTTIDDTMVAERPPLMVAERPPLMVAERPPEPSVEPSVEPSSRRAAAQRQPRKRDPLFDAVAEACEINPAELTRSARGAVNRALADLRDVDATPAEVRTRAKRHEQKWPNVSLTATSLAKHWPELAPPVRRQPAPRPPTEEPGPAPAAHAAAAIAEIRAQLGRKGRHS